ncbi:PREDICTED: myosin-IIIa-like [Acropora digitifera]|uniref:myosin-IIIa-like n=1 Tax=Acropora digitifera TaxID=70779 RepID=UPI00077ADA63|nr:PREDICTED: myosin-IIIa-like [Acropora digitifera]
MPKRFSKEQSSRYKDEFSYIAPDPAKPMMGKTADSLKELGAPDNWELVESIGEGTYGEVYKARNKITGEIAAAKVIDSIHEKIEEVLPELDILKKYASHPNIANFYGAFINVDTKRHDQLWLVMELCRGGSVTNLVKSLRKKGKYLDEDLIAFILYETLKGIEHLHRNFVMHRDIKGPNVMLTKGAEIRLIDFGVSAELSNILMRRNSSVGTPFWMAPEVIACEQQLDYSYDVRCDIWSLGITAIELADGVTPLSDQHPMRALFKIPRSKSPSMKNPERWSHEYRDFIAKLVNAMIMLYEFQTLNTGRFIACINRYKMFQLRRKLMNLMDKQYQGRDGITDEVDEEKELEKSASPSIVQNKIPLKFDDQIFKVDNLAELGSLTEDIILSHLLGRYLIDNIYTYIGDILIAINPLKTLDLYGPEEANKYKNAQKSALPPHIFMVADMTHQAMVHNKSPQCCLISGESGAGKTVSADYLVRHLAELGKVSSKRLMRSFFFIFLSFCSCSYLQTGGRNLQDLACTLGNRRKFEEVQRCLDIIGFSHEEVSQLFSILAAVIHLGDIHFTEDESVSHLSDKSMVNNPQVLLIVSSLLGINAVELRDALTTNSSVTRGETIVRNNSVDQAVDYRDGMAKALYGKLFSWIVYRINALLRTERARLTVDNDCRIGILDIFGFENFKRNSFEQLCINIANEQIQFYFNQQIFSWELVSLLLRFPKNFSRNFAEKFHKNLCGPHYEQPKETDVYPSFAVVHYAGRVKYDATNFLEKNRDTLSPDIIHVLRSSDNRLVRTLMQHTLSTSGVTSKKSSSQLPKMQMEKEKKLSGPLSLPETKRTLSVASTSRWQQTVSMHFRYSLRDLLAKLLPAEPHFVRCIRPNEQMIPGEFDQDKVQTQLKYTGVLETTRIRQQIRYQILCYPLHKKIPSDPSSCVQILEQCKIQNWLMGRTKVFLKYYHVEELARFLDIYRQKVVILQKVARGWIMRRRYEKLKRERYWAASVLQKHWRTYVVQKYYRRMIKRRRKAAVVIQRLARVYLARKRFQRLRHRRLESAIKIQAVKVAGGVNFLILSTGLKQQAAVRIQTAYRGFKCRKDFSKLKLKAQTNKAEMIIFLQQIENSSDALLQPQRGHKNVTHMFCFLLFNNPANLGFLLAK